MAQPSDPYVFVSYSSQNKDVVHFEIKRLEEQGYRIWYDKGNETEGLLPGRSFTAEIDGKILGCSCFVVFLTKPALDSRHVQAELKRALEVGKPFIRIDWEEIDWEKTELPFSLVQTLKDIQAIEHYELHTSDYMRKLGYALEKYVEKANLCTARKEERLFQESPASIVGIPPKAVFFFLMLLVALLFFLAVLAFFTPIDIAQQVNSPLSNRVLSILVACVFLTLVAITGAAAFIVYRKYLRRNRG